MANQYKNKVIYNGQTLIDLTGVTVTPEVLLQGYTAIDASGAPIVGTASGGGSSSWTKVAETSYTIENYTSTSAATEATWETGHSELWTDEKWVYVRIRDTAGKRAGYFYGSDQFFVVYSTTAMSTTTGSRFTWRYTSSGTYGANTSSGSTGYGVYADTLYSDGRIRIRKRYNSANTLTIDGTYKVEVYLLDPPTGAPIFT